IIVETSIYPVVRERQDSSRLKMYRRGSARFAELKRGEPRLYDVNSRRDKSTSLRFCKREPLFRYLKKCYY
ncbi:MAG: hypothetical protein UR60_C0048G0007, partial [Candidatus Moranbacteria bacterium GW2011_GWF2_34_56]